MTRISAPASPGPIARATLSAARRKTRELTDREIASMLEPIEAFAHSPGLMLGYCALELANGRAHRVEHRLKELVVLKAATMAGCEYCIDIGSALARKSGLSDEQLLALPRYRASELFSELQMLVLDYAVAISRTPVEVPDQLFAALRERLDDEQLVELTATIALENFRARFNAALDIGAAGFSEGMVCALPEPDETGEAPASSASGEHDDGGPRRAVEPATAPAS